MKRIAFVVLATGCFADGSGGGGLDRRQLLSDLADHVILPHYRQFRDETTILAARTEALCDAPSGQSLIAVQEAWRSARKPWKRSEAFQFGPAMDLRIDGAVDFWPVRTEDVEAVLRGADPIDDGYLDGLGSTRKGLPVLEYLLFDADANAFAADPRRCAYATAVARDVAEQAAALVSAWEDGFADELIEASNGSTVYPMYIDVFTAIVNQMISAASQMESMKLAKPLGRQDGGVPQPDSVEAPYSGNALVDLRENVAGIAAVYTSGDPSHVGLDDAVLLFAPELHPRLQAQLGATASAIGAIPPPLAEAVTSHPSAVEDAYVAAKELLRLLAADVSGALGTTPTFSDNDGD